MKIKRRNNKLSQSTIAYIIFIIVLLGAFSAMVPKVRQKFQASYKESADAFGEGRLGSPSTSGGVAPFVFPVLPVSPPVHIFKPFVDTPECNPERLKCLLADAMNKQKIFSELSQEAGAANLAAVQAKEAETKAEVAARIAKEKAVQARQEATYARRAANAKRSKCNSCEEDCKAICDEARRLERVARQKEAIAADKERIAKEKEADYQAKRAEARRLEGIAQEKTQVAARAGEEAMAAAERLRRANEACGIFQRV